MFLPKVRKKSNIWIPFLISPFIALLYGIKYYRMPWAKNTVWLFIIFFGVTITASTGTGDIQSYVEQLRLLSSSLFSWSNLWNHIYTGETDPVTGKVYLDLFQPFTAYLVTYLYSGVHLFYGIVGVVFGYFYSRNIWGLIEKGGGKIKRENILLIVVFAFIISFSSMQSVRMWTTAHIFFFGAFWYIYDGNKKGILLLLLTPLFHYSYLFAIIVFALFYFLGNRLHFYFAFFTLTFFLEQVDATVIRETLLNILPDAFHGRVYSYTPLDADESGMDSRVWYVRFYRIFLQWIIFAFIVMIYLKGREFINKNHKFLTLFSFALLFLGAANIASMVAAGGRFISVASLFAMASIFLYLQLAPKERFMKNLLPLTYPFLLLYIIVSLRIAFEWVSVMTILGNPILRLFGNIDIALNELIR